jgi:DNA-binding response OmpR family regulator
MRILVVDDDRHLASFIESGLERGGCSPPLIHTICVGYLFADAAP